MNVWEVRTMQHKNLREPSRGWVRWPDCVQDELVRAVWTIDKANAVMAATTGYEKHNEPSAMEVWLLAAYRYYGLEPDCQVQIGRYWVDFYFPDGNLAVEVDGRQWHQDALRERRRDNFIRGTDTGVIHFWGSEVFRDPLWCARQTIWALNDRRMAAVA